jgi:hypothetical protein
MELTSENSWSGRRCFVSAMDRSVYLRREYELSDRVCSIFRFHRGGLLDGEKMEPDGVHEQWYPVGELKELAHRCH